MGRSGQVPVWPTLAWETRRLRGTRLLPETGPGRDCVCVCVCVGSLWEWPLEPAEAPGGRSLVLGLTNVGTPQGTQPE